MLKSLALLFSLAVLLPSFGGSRLVSLMTYNVENLFDNKFDVGKEDYTYLPLSLKIAAGDAFYIKCNEKKSDFYKNLCLKLNWDQDALNKKILNLSKVITAPLGGRGPDILVLTEVENIDVLKKLAQIGLANQGYKYFSLIEGPDKRGIDVGIISRFKLYEQKLHIVSREFKTRGILEATFIIDGIPFTIFGNHWPSQFNPDSKRVQAAQTLYKAVSANRNRYRGLGLIVATGDFNVTSRDRVNALDIITNRNYPYWFYNFQDIFVESGGGNWHGTYFFRKHWDELDRVFVLNDSFDNSCNQLSWCVFPLWKSFKVVRERFMLRSFGDFLIPFRFNPITLEGYSDHLPALAFFNFYTPN